MPNNVYIGSRYVPIFDGDWDNTKVYEPLTIVNYNGGSYTSKRNVPAGTIPTNTTYWALTGNYNGQIAGLQQQINTINNDIDTIENTTIPAIQGSVNTINNTTIPAIENEIDNLEASIIDVTQGPVYQTGSTVISDHDIHSIASVELPARGRYIMLFKADFEFPASESGVIHSLEMEVSPNASITFFGQGRATYVGREFTSNGNNTVASLVLPYQITPQSDLTLYLYVRDRSTGTSVKAYPYITATNFA